MDALDEQHRQDARDRRLKELTYLRRLTCLKECKGLKVKGYGEVKGDGEVNIYITYIHTYTHT